MPRSSAKGAKWCVIVFFACAFRALPACAEPPQGERTAAALMKVEHQWLAALHRRDVTMLARILAREFIDSDFQGDVISRAQYLAYFSRPAAHPAPVLRQHFDDTRVRLISAGNVAIVTGVVVTQTVAPGARASMKADAARYSRFTDVFIWRDGRWQAVTGQETHFAPGENH